MRYLLADGNVIIADQDFIDAVHPGATVVVEAVIANTNPFGRKMTIYAFRMRFIQTEKDALYTAAKTNVTLESFLDDLASATHVDYELPDAGNNLSALVAMGIITSQRRTIILTTPVAAHEVPK